MHFYQHKGVLTGEQNTGDFNPLHETVHGVQLNKHVPNNDVKLKDIVLHHRTVQSVYWIYIQLHCIPSKFYITSVSLA